MGKSLAVFGTASDVGKSIVCTAICRILSDRGLHIAPFKAQNMSNNSCVTNEEGELARAQYVQAEAARVLPSVHMNPVLLKPSDDLCAQLVLRGKVVGNRNAWDYFSNTDQIYKEALESLNLVRSNHDFIVVEGAGSCAEVNLRDRDFVNFKIAHYLEAPVILVADIDRGGVFAQIIGTLAVLPEADRRRIKGILINRFRGDARLFEDGIRYIEEQTKLPVLGLIPYYRNIDIDSEDSLPQEFIVDPPLEASNRIQIAVIYFPHISNFTDFSALQREDLQLHYLSKARDLSKYHAVILPGSKNTRSDLRWLKETGWEASLRAYADSGGRIVGICGGFQMLGLSLEDSLGVESSSGEDTGLGFLNVKTRFLMQKTLTQVQGSVLETGEEIFGYEIHHGVTERLGECKAFVYLKRVGSDIPWLDGAVSEDGRIWGCYVHGIFDSTSFRKSFLKDIGGDLYKDTSTEDLSTFHFRQSQYDLLADHFRKHMDVHRLFEIAGLNL